MEEEEEEEEEEQYQQLEYILEEFVLPPEHLRHAGRCLPELTDELTSAQSSLCSEVSRKEAVLIKLGTEQREVQQELQSTENRVCSSIRSICLKEDVLAGLSQECESLEKELITLGLEKQQLEVNLSAICKEKQATALLRTSYKAKMDAYRAKINEMKDTPTQLEIKALRKRIESLREKRSSCGEKEDVDQLLSGLTQRLIQSQLQEISSRQASVQQESKDLEMKMKGNQRKIEVLKKSRETEKKRQAAQVRRLQRLVNEAHARRRQWMQEEEQLRASVQQMKVKMST